MHSNRMPTRHVLTRLTPLMLAAGALLPFTLFIEQNPIDLAGPVAVAAFYTAESGGVGVLPVIIFGMAFCCSPGPISLGDSGDVPSRQWCLCCRCFWAGEPT